VRCCGTVIFGFLLVCSFLVSSVPWDGETARVFMCSCCKSLVVMEISPVISNRSASEDDVSILPSITLDVSASRFVVGGAL